MRIKLHLAKKTTHLFIVLLLVTNCIKKTASKEIFKDTFSRDDSGTTLGENWTLYKPNGNYISIKNKMAKPIAGTSTAIGEMPTALYTAKVKGGFKVSSKFIISGGDYDSMGYLIARSAASDIPTDAYLCGYYYSLGTTSPKKYYFTLSKISAGALTHFAEVGMHTLTTGKTDTITFTLDGTSLKCEMAGNSTISISIVDSAFGDGYTGILGGGGALNTNYLYFDDFLIEKL